MKILLLIVACLLILISLFQGGKTEGFSTSTPFINVKERGTEKLVSRVTFGLIICFFTLIFVINYI